jgi:hypothetical protein
VRYPGQFFSELSIGAGNGNLVFFFFRHRLKIENPGVVY